MPCAAKGRMEIKDYSSAYMEAVEPKSSAGLEKLSIELVGRVRKANQQRPDKCLREW
jgi:hypothetical protein